MLSCAVVKTSSKIEATAAVEALLKALNTDPFYINVNISSIDTIIHNVSLDSDSMLVGAVMIVVGTIVMILAQVIFLSSFIVTYGASDAANFVQMGNVWQARKNAMFCF